MRASRLFTMFDDQPDAKVFVDVHGHLIPVIGAEYRDGAERAVVLSIDPFELVRKIGAARASRENRA